MVAGPVRTIATGIYFGEGPRWHDGRLWFSDFHSHRVCSVGEDGEVRTELEVDDQPSGLGWMPDGSLLVVLMKARAVWRRWPDGRFTRHADLADVSAHLCNDMVVDGQGRAYVGNFGFDLDAAIRERGAPAVMADHPKTTLVLVQPDGTVSVAADDMSFPNGTVITPDGKTLIVGESLAARLTAFDIAADGALTNRRVWAATQPYVPDGICLDADGAIWVANPIGPQCVRIAESGKVLDVVDTGLPCFACMLGGPDGRTLHMLIAANSDHEEAAKAPTGQLIACEVDAARAGWP
jgi:sugar lactone lactonase YvrE